jgi:hypothetical protein
VAVLNKTAIISALMATLAACAPGLKAEGDAAPARALYTPAIYSAPYSFSDIFRMSLEAEAGLAPNLLLPDPSGTSAMVLPAGLLEPVVPLSAGPVVASRTARRAAESPSLRSWDLPQPSGWLTLVSALAVIGFIAWRRSDGGD